MHKSGLFLLLAGVSVAFGQQYSITTVAGGAPPPTPVAATSTTIGQPSRVTVDSAGNYYFSSGHSVFRVSGSTLTVIAGNSRAGFSGDGGPAINAQLNTPAGLAVDKAGNLYIADSINNRVRIVTPDGLINTFAGNGFTGNVNAVGDGGPANQAQLSLPSGVTADSSGNVFIADTNQNLIRKVTPDGNIATFAGIGYPGFAGDGGPAIAASVNHPEDVFVDTKGNVFIADTLDGAIREVTTDGNINTVAGNGSIGYSGDGGPATKAGLIEPFSVVVDGSGNIFFAEPEDGRIREVDTKGNINTIAGNGTLGFSGDGGPGTSATLYLPTGVAVDSSGNVYIADSHNTRIRKLSGGNINTIAGNGGISYSGDGGAAVKSQLNAPQGAAVDSSGTFYVADTANNAVRKVASNGSIATIAGNGSPGSGNSQLNGPQGVAVDSSGNVYVADTQNARVLKISGGSISTLAGNGTQGFGGDNGPAGSAQLNSPIGVAVDKSGNVYIADFGNNRIRMVNSGGAISTIAGTTQGYSGDGGAATAAQLNNPQGVAVDSAGRVYIADTANNRVRMVSGGVISTIAGTGIAGSSGDGGPAVNAQLVSPAGIAVDGSGNVYVSDLSIRIRKIYPGGPIFTIGGTGAAGYTGDGGLGTAATMNGPSGLGADSKGNVYIADTMNNAVRMLASAGVGISVSAVTGAATNALGAVAPGEALVLYGSGMGPANVVSNTFNSLGFLSNTLAGTTVYINGVAAPILYTSATQVSAVVPFAVSGSTTSIYVVYQGQVSNAVSAGVAPTAPGLFTVDFSGKGQAAAVNNTDGSMNGAAHPAKAGTYIQLYLTGGGQTNPPGTDGQQNTVPLPVAASTVTVTIGGKSAPVNFSGGAPGSVQGVWQVNAQIPAGLTAGAVPVVVSVGGVSSQSGVTIAVN
jgi:uncharacterized protein (TIGR03437 family)